MTMTNSSPSDDYSSRTEADRHAIPAILAQSQSIVCPDWGARGRGLTPSSLPVATPQLQLLCSYSCFQAQHALDLGFLCFCLDQTDSAWERERESSRSKSGDPGHAMFAMTWGKLGARRGGTMKTLFSLSVIWPRSHIPQIPESADTRRQKHCLPVSDFGVYLMQYSFGLISRARVAEIQLFLFWKQIFSVSWVWNVASVWH